MFNFVDTISDLVFVVSLLRYRLLSTFFRIDLCDDINTLYNWLLLLFIINACSAVLVHTFRTTSLRIFIIILIIRSIIKLFNQYVLVGLQFYKVYIRGTAPTPAYTIHLPLMLYALAQKADRRNWHTNRTFTLNALQTVTLTSASCIQYIRKYYSVNDVWNNYYYQRWKLDLNY